MTIARSFLIDALRRVKAGGDITNNELSVGVPNPLTLDDVERLAWQRLSHWADDEDIRAKDSSYAEWQQREAAKALADLEAIEAGYLPIEVERGEHQASPFPIVGCLLAAGGLAVILYLMFASGFFMHGDP